MIEIIYNHVMQGNPRQVLYWQKLLYDLNTRVEYYRTSRFLLAPVVHSPLVNLLKYLILEIDIDYLLKQSSDLDRYSKYLSFETDHLKQAFDPVWKGSLSKNIFLSVKTGKQVPEVIINSSFNNPLLDLPIDKDWYNWESISPIHILYHDSLEMVTSLHRFSIKFKVDHPSVLVASIDIDALVLKYIRYLIATDGEGDVDHFIHVHVINNLYRDLTRNWLMNIMIKELEEYDGTYKYKTYKKIITPLYVDVAFNPAMNNFQKEYNLCKNLNIRFQDFLSTDWFVGYSILDYIKTLMSEVTFPPHNQYAFAKMLKELPIVKFVVIANNKRPSSHPEVKQLNMLLRRVFERYQRNKVWRMVRSPAINTLLENEINSLYEMTTR